MTEASDILDKAKKHYKSAKDGWQEIYQKQKDDLHFLSDERFAQWDKQEANARVTVGRPVVEVDQLSQFIHQVINDIRMNTPSIKVIPDSEDADVETAEIIAGRIKAIEYKSNADSAYDMAADFAVRSSIGYIRVDHDYINDKSFNQELKIKRVINPGAILIDPDSIEPDGSDAKYGFVLEEITVAKFKELYPKATPVTFGEDDIKTKPNDTDTITIAEYFVIEQTEEEIGLLDDGRTEPVNEKSKYKSTRKITKPKVYRYKLSGEDELEKNTFPGKYIPLVPVYGEEAWIEGKRKLNSLIRKSKSSQMAYNALKSSETEILLKQQQAPVQAAVGQMRGFENDWKHPEKAMVLYYHMTDASNNPCPPPLRLQPPVVSSGFANASLDAENNIRKTLGMYNAGVGKREGQSSGVALKQLEMSGDVASFHFGDNLVRSITQVGKILVCALPEIEDTSRIVNTIDAEDNHKLVGINGALAEGQKETYDFTKGSWDVRVTTGPSFTTQRQESAAYYAEVIKSAPDLMPVIGDLVFKYQDAPGAQAISSRLKKMVDPKLLDESEREDGSVDPQIQAMQMQMQQVVQEAQMQIQQLQIELQKKNVEEQKLLLDSRKLDIEEQKVRIEAYNAKKENGPVKVEPIGIKLDSSGFNIIKTPEQQAAEEQQAMTEAQLEEARLAQEAEQFSQQLMLKQQQEEQERQDKMAQTQAVIGALGNISQQLNVLTKTVSQPIAIERDEAGNIIGAK